MTEEKTTKILELLENIDRSLIHQRRPRYVTYDLLLTTIFSGVFGYFLFRILDHHLSDRRN